MSGRSRPPTDEQKTGFFDSKSVRPRPKSETTRGYSSGEEGTGVGLEIASPTRVEIATPTQVTRPTNKSEPLRVISMKTPAELAAERKRAQAVAGQHQLKAEIRSLADVHKRNDTPAHGMGYLAPPRDVKHVRARRLREWVLWGSVVVIVSCAVMLAVWFLAR